MPFCASAGASRGANLATRTGGFPRTRVQVCVDLSSRHGGPWRRQCRPSVPSVRLGREPLAREDAARAPCACPFSCPSVCRWLLHSPRPRRVRRLSPKPGLGDSAPCTPTPEEGTRSPRRSLSRLCPLCLLRGGSWGRAGGESAVAGHTPAHVFRVGTASFRTRPPRRSPAASASASATSPRNAGGSRLCPWWSRVCGSVFCVGGSLGPATASIFKYHLPRGQLPLTLHRPSPLAPRPLCSRPALHPAPCGPDPAAPCGPGCNLGWLEAGSPSASYYRGQNCLDFCN